MGNISTYSGQNYEYSLQGSWSDSVQALNAIIGDRVVDGNGKEFEITSFGSPEKFNLFRAKEVEAVGQPPVSGEATLYRPTDSFKFFQGRELGDFAFTTIMNRDKKLIDLNLVAGGSSNGDWEQVTRVITSGEASAKQLTLSPLPLEDTEVMVLIPGVIIPKPGTSYGMSSGVFSWGGFTLDGVLEEGDTVIFNYFS